MILMRLSSGAAKRSPEDCDKNPEQARRINVDATRALAEATSSRGILLIYISTDYVFSGIEGEAPYAASSLTSPMNRYGELKRDGEIATLEATRDNGLGIVLRVPLLYGPAEDNTESAVNVLLNTVNKAQDPNAGIKMDDWAQRYPTNTEDVGRVCQDIVVEYLQKRDKISSLPKILQFSSEDQMTKYEICEKLAQILGTPIPGMMRNKEGNDPSALVKRPFNTHLSTKELKDLGINVHTQDFVAWWYVLCI
jgi:dTDP-4-dehydrorhamnose reductase